MTYNVCFSLLTYSMGICGVGVVEEGVGLSCSMTSMVGQFYIKSIKDFHRNVSWNQRSAKPIWTHLIQSDPAWSGLRPGRKNWWNCEFKNVWRNRLFFSHHQTNQINVWNLEIVCWRFSCVAWVHRRSSNGSVVVITYILISTSCYTYILR